MYLEFVFVVVPVGVNIYRKNSRYWCKKCCEEALIIREEGVDTSISTSLGTIHKKMINTMTYEERKSICWQIYVAQMPCRNYFWPEDPLINLWNG